MGNIPPPRPLYLEMINEQITGLGLGNAGYMFDMYPSGVVDLVRGPAYDLLYKATDDRLAQRPQTFSNYMGQSIASVNANRTVHEQYEEGMFVPFGIQPMHVTGAVDISTFTYAYFRILTTAADIIDCATADSVYVIIFDHPDRSIWQSDGNYADLCADCRNNPATCYSCIGHPGTNESCNACPTVDETMWPDGFDTTPAAITKLAPDRIPREIARKKFLMPLSKMGRANDLCNATDDLAKMVGKGAYPDALNEMKTFFVPTRSLPPDSNRSHRRCVDASSDDLGRLHCSLQSCPNTVRIVIPVILTVVTYTDKVEKDSYTGQPKPLEKRKLKVGDTHSNLLVFERETGEVFRIEPTHPCAHRCWNKLYERLIQRYNNRYGTSWVFRGGATQHEDKAHTIAFQNPRSDNCAGWGMYIYTLLILNPTITVRDITAHLVARMGEYGWTSEVDRVGVDTFKQLDGLYTPLMRDFLRFGREVVYSRTRDNDVNVYKQLTETDVQSLRWDSV